MGKKICLITGANSGIGRAAAVQIAAEGHRVILGCRDPERGAAAVEHVRSNSGSDEVELELMDLSLQASLRDAAQRLGRRHEQLDVLIHNAATFDVSQKEPRKTAEDVETLWATNHLGPVLLTDLLLPMLRRAPQGRVLTVASKGLAVFPFLRVDLDDPEFQSRRFSVTRAYYQSKLAQVMYTLHLATELADTAVTANCIRVTNVKLDMDRFPEVSEFAKKLYRVKARFSISPEEMARTYTHLALGVDYDEVSGVVFDDADHRVQPSRVARDPEEIAKLMALTRGYLGGGSEA